MARKRAVVGPNYPILTRITPPALPGSPINVDAAERNTRGPQGGIFWAEPSPPIYGALVGMFPMQDLQIYAGAFRVVPYGPGTTVLPNPFIPTAVGTWNKNLQAQSIVPGFNKYTFG